MGALTTDALFRGLKKGAVDPVYYLYGDEDVLKDDVVREIADHVLEPSTRDFNYDTPDPAGLDPQRLRSLVDTPPMLAARRLVVVRGIEGLRKKSRAREALLSYLNDPNPTTVLVLIQGAGDDEADDLLTATSAVRLDGLAPDRVERWMARRAEKAGLTLAEGAAHHLLEATGGSLGAAAREIEKLASAVRDRPATKDDVAALVGVRIGATVADLVAAALDRRAAQAARLVEPVLEQAGVNGVRVVTALGTALVGTALARAELDAGAAVSRAEQLVYGHLQAARPYGLGSWREEAARWVRWAQRWTAAELRRALRATLDADRALKGMSLTDDRGIVSGLVLSW